MPQTDKWRCSAVAVRTQWNLKVSNFDLFSQNQTKRNKWQTQQN
jgi:hypothetical protein